MLNFCWLGAMSIHKIQNFPPIVLIFCQKLAKFVTLPLKLDNPCHAMTCISNRQ